MPSGRGRIDPPQIKKKKESPRKQLPICSTTKPVCSTHALLSFRLTHYAIWEGKDRPSTDKGKKRKSMQAIAYKLNHQACMLNPCLTILTRYAIWEGKDRPSTDRKNVNKTSSSQNSPTCILICFCLPVVCDPPPALQSS